MGVLTGKVVGAPLKGFALMESIFAMVTIMICFSVCMMVFNMIASGGTGTRMVNARIRLQAGADACKEKKEFNDEVTTMDEFIVERTFVSYRNNPAVLEMQLVARDHNGKIIAEYHELIFR